MQLYEKYVTETVDEKTGRLTKIDFHIPDDFNFGFDVVDFWGKNTPDKTALLWVGEHHEEKTFTFSDMMRLTNKTANSFFHRHLVFVHVLVGILENSVYGVTTMVFRNTHGC